MLPRLLLVLLATEELARAETVRLANGSSSADGRLEIYRADAWITACHGETSWTAPNSRVVCRQLGYIDAARPHVDRRLRDDVLANESIFISIDGVTCTGREKNLSECTRSGWVETNDCHNGVGIECSKFDFSKINN